MVKAKDFKCRNRAVVREKLDTIQWVTEDYYVILTPAPGTKSYVVLKSPPGTNLYPVGCQVSLETTEVGFPKGGKQHGEGWDIIEEID